MEKNNKYVKRTGPLLFLYFKESNAYLINIYNHGDWTKKEVLQTMYDNWPELIEPFILNGMKESDQELSEKERLKLRKSGITTTIELKDKNGKAIICGPPGMSITLSGVAIIDVQTYYSLINYLLIVEDYIRDKTNNIKDYMIENEIKIPETFKFSLIRNKGIWYIKEENSNLDICI